MTEKDEVMCLERCTDGAADEGCSGWAADGAGLLVKTVPKRFNQKPVYYRLTSSLI